ncbi:hypothetical protein ACSYDW_14620 [Paeniglutamicibacter sp. R2-26]|uniref:hypothetical protein n=1 Tax=Paeniglutamicibacter sp. R2-26 TaxID=3144417 RepID=UPI003EE60F7A
MSNGADDQMLILLSLAAAVDDTLTGAHDVLASEARGDINRWAFNAPVHKQPALGNALATFTASILAALATEGYEFIAEFAQVLAPPV